MLVNMHVPLREWYAYPFSVQALLYLLVDVEINAPVIRGLHPWTDREINAEITGQEKSV